MPSYDYLCPDCGPFTAMRPMAEFEAAHACRGCGADAPRALLTAPLLAGMDAGRRRAGEVNERSAHAPARAKRHPAGCGCCAGPGRRAVGADAVGARSFPAQRPWMIGH